MKFAILFLIPLFITGCNAGAPIPSISAAAREGDTARMTELIKAGADLNERGGVNNWTPLMHAVHKNQPAAVRVLVAAGADLNATAGLRGRDTALHLAESEGYQEIVNILRHPVARTGP